jgi:hypothetical protein
VPKRAQRRPCELPRVGELVMLLFVVVDVVVAWLLSAISPHMIIPLRSRLVI